MQEGVTVFMGSTPVRGITGSADVYIKLDSVLSDIDSMNQ